MDEQYYESSKTLIQYNNEEEPTNNNFRSSSNDSAREFDCNICLDMVQDPVITLCGHLYCWPCIYKWIQYSDIEELVSCEKQPSDQHCPVCNAYVSVNSLVPLYGRGLRSGSWAHGKDVPRRPNGLPACGPAHTRLSDHRPRRYHGLAGTTTYDWMFRNSDSGVYGYTNTYGSARLRRHEVMADRSLSRVSFFIFCCVIVCLLLF